MENTWSEASYGRLANFSADIQEWWKYNAAPWSISQRFLCQRSRFGLRGVRSTFVISASSHTTSAASSGGGGSVGV